VETPLQIKVKYYIVSQIHCYNGGPLINLTGKYYAVPSSHPYFSTLTSNLTLSHLPLASSSNITPILAFLPPASSP